MHMTEFDDAYNTLRTLYDRNKGTSIKQEAILSCIQRYVLLIDELLEDLKETD